MTAPTNIGGALRVLFPAAVAGVDFIIIDNLDGPDGASNPQIVKWNDALGPQPDPVALAAAAAQFVPPAGPKLAMTDYAMARAFEELVPVLIAKGVIASADLAPAALVHLNARRALRGLQAIK